MSISNESLCNQNSSAFIYKQAISSLKEKIESTKSKRIHLKNELSCPITLEFVEQKNACLLDGHIYDTDSIIKWFKTKSSSTILGIPVPVVPVPHKNCPANNPILLPLDEARTKTYTKLDTIEKELSALSSRLCFLTRENLEIQNQETDESTLFPSANSSSSSQIVLPYDLRQITEDPEITTMAFYCKVCLPILLFLSFVLFLSFAVFGVYDFFHHTYFIATFIRQLINLIETVFVAILRLYLFIFFTIEILVIVRLCIYAFLTGFLFPILTALRLVSAASSYGLRNLRI